MHDTFTLTMDLLFSQLFKQQLSCSYCSKYSKQMIS